MTAWKATPFPRRAAVLVILFESFNSRTQQVELSTVLTTRAQHLSSFSGHVALPGGKADFEQEPAVTVAHREAHEEIHFPEATPKLLSLSELLVINDQIVATNEANPDSEVQEFEGNGITDVGNFPSYLSRNMLAVTPVIAYVPTKVSPSFHIPESYYGLPHVLGTNQELSTILSDDGEVSEVFSVPLRHFLYTNHPEDSSNFQQVGKPFTKNHEMERTYKERGVLPWYKGEPIKWNGLAWHQHHYHVLRRTNKKIGEASHFNVWGMTARFLLDIARIAYDETPQMPYSSTIGDEKLILKLNEIGVLQQERSKKDIHFSFEKALGKDSEFLKSRL